MIRRVFSWLCCASMLWAQLPQPQAPRPRNELSTNERRRSPERHPDEIARVDMVVTDPQGRRVPGLKAADFVVEADGKPVKVESCEYREGQPLRLAVVVDDLSLSLE